MIRIHLSRLMGEHKEKLSDLMRSTGLARNTCSGLYHETTSRLDIETLNAICKHYECRIADLLEYVPDTVDGVLDDEESPNKTGSTRHGGGHE